MEIEPSDIEQFRKLLDRVDLDEALVTAMLDVLSDRVRKLRHLPDA